MPHKIEDKYFEFNSEEVVYDDRYKMSIMTLLRKHRPITAKVISALLDASGYVGRHRVRYTGVPKKHQSTGIVIDITLPWSDITYRWPSAGYYVPITGKLSVENSIAKEGLKERLIEQSFYYVNMCGHTAEVVMKYVETDKPTALRYLNVIQSAKVVSGEGVYIREINEYKEYLENALGVKFTGMVF